MPNSVTFRTAHRDWCSAGRLWKTTQVTALWTTETGERVRQGVTLGFYLPRVKRRVVLALN